jgi:hypothetical protein
MKAPDTLERTTCYSSGPIINFVLVDAPPSPLFGNPIQLFNFLVIALIFLPLVSSRNRKVSVSEYPLEFIAAFFVTIIFPAAGDVVIG